MGVLAEIAEDQDPRFGMCRVCEWIEKRPAEEREEFIQAMADESFTTRSIERAMTRRKFKISYSSIERHRMRKHQT